MWSNIVSGGSRVRKSAYLTFIHKLLGYGVSWLRFHLTSVPHSPVAVVHCRHWAFSFRQPSFKSTFSTAGRKVSAATMHVAVPTAMT